MGSEDDQKKQGAKNKKTALLYFVTTIILLSLYGTRFFYPNLNQYKNANNVLSNLQHKISEYETKTLPDLEADRSAEREAYEAELARKGNTINQIFPVTMDKTGITQRLESFASLINTKTPPFEMNRLSFSDPINGKGYTVLPISTSITTSRANLDRFMKLIDLSGHAESEYPIRLMEIEELNVRFLGIDSRTGRDKGVTANIKLKAYSRPDTVSKK